MKRTAPSKSEREDLVAYIHGIEPQGDVAHILVHQKGNSIRFSGKLGDHRVSPSNAGDLGKWVSEAEAVWGLDDAIGVMRSWMNIDEIKEKLDTMNIKAAEKRKHLEVPGLV
jgi:hypothetical protein